MSASRVLYITAREMGVYCFRAGRLVDAFAFAFSPEGLDGFSAYLTSEPGGPVSLLADVTEEEFRLEQIPYAGLLERAPLHSRHAQRLFRSTPFISANPIGRTDEGRRDECVLFSALTQPDALIPWLERLEAAHVPLLAISSVAHVGALLCERFGVQRGDLLLVTEQEGAGVRQSWYRDGRLRMSRLSPACTSGSLSPEAFAKFVSEEISRTRRYIDHMDRRGAGASLSIALISTGEHLAALRRRSLCTDSEVHWVEISDLYLREGISSHPIPAANALYAALFATHRRNCYAQRIHLKRRHIYRLGRTLDLAAVGLALATTILVATTGAQTIKYRRAATALIAVLASQPEPTVLESSEQLPLGLAPEQIETAVVSAERLLALKIEPRVALQSLGTVLVHYPELLLSRLEWVASTRSDFSDPNDSSERFPHDGAIYHAVVVTGTVAESTGASTRFNEFVTALRRASPVSGVEVITRPIAASRLSDDGGEAATMSLPFSLRVAFKP